MADSMKVLVLGATGRTGKHVLDCLLKKGYVVHALVRKKSKIKDIPEKIRLFQGDPRNNDDLSTAIHECSAVINVLNISRRSDFPWAPLRTPPAFLSETARNLINVAEKKQIGKIIACSAWGVHETEDEIPLWFRWFIHNSNIGAAYRDHERQETLLRESNLNFTIVRPVGLTNSKRERTIQISQNNIPKPRLTISRKSVAKVLVDMIESDAKSRQCITISHR
jgi:uncharacterized protein YbjT (DUF2867 family)